MVNDNGEDRRPAAFAILAERRAFPLDSPHIASIARKGIVDPRSLSAPEILQLCKTVAAQIAKLKQD